MVSVLIDNDVAADEIKETFKSDGDVKRALAHYLKDLEDDDEEDQDDDDDGDDEDY